VVKAYHQNAEVYSGEVKLAGASAEVELVDYGGDIAFFGQLYTPGLVFQRLVIEVRNTGDVLPSSRAMMLGVECSSVELRVAPGSFVCLDFVLVAQ
jgi:hypothetical protein